MVTHVKSLLLAAREDEEFDIVFSCIPKTADMANISLEIPRRCRCQTQRNNMPANTPTQYFKTTIFFPFLDSIIMELNSRFGDLASQSIQGLKCIPSHATGPMEQKTVEEMYYEEDLPSPN